MPVTRREFLELTSAGLFSLANLPLKQGIVPLQSRTDNFDILSLPPPRVIVIGVGGAGGAVVNLLMKHRQPDVVHLCVDTDAQALNYYDTDLRLRIGQPTKPGFCYAGPEYGRRAAEDSREAIQETLAGANLVLLMGGMGGATATGAIPVIAQLAQEAGVLTVNIVTYPFGFEGPQRSRQAAPGFSELQRHGTTTVVVPMDGVLEMVASDATLRHAYDQADHTIRVVTSAIINSIMAPRLINVTFSDVRAVLADRGASAMGTGVGRGRNRAVEAAQAALRCPLLGNAKISSASGLLVNIAGDDIKLWEVEDFMNLISRSLNDEALVSFGDTPNPNLRDEAQVTLIAAGASPAMSPYSQGHPGIQV